VKDRTDKKYVVKIYEAQWDDKHNESVKPFFAQLKRECQRGNCGSGEDGNDPLFSYYVFGTADGLSAALNHKLDVGLDGRLKIGYFGVHGQENQIQPLIPINRVKFRNIMIKTTNFDGLYFGACDFVNLKTAESLLNNISTLKWVAGFAKWTPWLEGMMCDIMFFRLLFSGRFRRPARTNTKWDVMIKPEDAARNLYQVFPMAVDLKFSLFYRSSSGVIKSTLEEYKEVNLV
jgi:hypothetical protein